MLDLRGNQILDFSAIAGLIDNLVEYNTSSQTPPTFKAEDVNRDGVVNVLDLLLIAVYIHNPDSLDLSHYDIDPDVNSDGLVNVKDLIAIAAELDDEPAASSLREQAVKIPYLTAENIAQWLSLAKQLKSQDRQMQEGIAVLETLLAALTIAEETPKVTSLLANYPNPFNPETWLPYQLAEATNVQFHIYGSAGRLVRTLDLGFRNGGFYLHKDRAAYWDGRNNAGEKLASGIYFYQLVAGDYTATRRLVIVK